MEKRRGWTPASEARDYYPGDRVVSAIKGYRAHESFVVFLADGRMIEGERLTPDGEFCWRLIANVTEVDLSE